MTLAIAIGFFAIIVLLVVERRARLAAEDYSRRVLAGAAEEASRSKAELLAVIDAGAKERKELYQRIQAPEIAVHEAQLERRRERPYVRREPVGADNDAAFAARRAPTKTDEESTD